MTTMIKAEPAYQMPFSITEFSRTSFLKFRGYLKHQRSHRADCQEFRRLAARDDFHLYNSGLSRSDMTWAYNSKAF